MRYQELVERHFDIRSTAGEEAMCLCVFHDDSNASLQINMTSGLFICFSCDAKGGPTSLFAEVGLDIRGGTDPDTDIRDVIEKIKVLQKTPRLETERHYTESYLLQFEHPTDWWKDNRDFSPETVARFQLGYDPMGDAMTIPIRDVDRNLLGVVRRFNNPGDGPRYMYPKTFKRNRHLFGDWLVESDPTATHVVLTEGALDAIRVTEAGYNGMAIYGSSLSEAQIRLLRRLGVLKVSLFFDDDTAGRKATEGCLGISHNRRKGRTIKDYKPEHDLRNFFVVDHVRYPTDALPSWKEGKEAFDPGDMNLKDIDRLLNNTVRTL